MVLHRLAYPNRLCDLVWYFGCSEYKISTIVNETISFLCWQHEMVMNDCFAPWLDHIQMADIISQKGCPLSNVWGFIDGTLMRTCHPKYNQEVLFSGHKRHYGVKYQMVMAPNGMIVHVYGPYPGRNHNLGLLEASKLSDQLCQNFDNRGNPMLIYGDKAYNYQ